MVLPHGRCYYNKKFQNLHCFTLLTARLFVVTTTACHMAKWLGRLVLEFFQTCTFVGFLRSLDFDDGLMVILFTLFIKRGHDLFPPSLVVVQHDIASDRRIQVVWKSQTV